MTKVHLQNKWAETNNSVCALLRQAHDVLALTSLPMQQVRKPLTEEELKQCSYDENGFMISREDAMRAVERAHGIGVEE
jgi:hypothetical protein